MEGRDLALLTDLYELTMMQGYFKNPTDQTVVLTCFTETIPVAAHSLSVPVWSR